MSYAKSTVLSIICVTKVLDRNIELSMQAQIQRVMRLKDANAGKEPRHPI